MGAAWVGLLLVAAVPAQNLPGVTQLVTMPFTPPVEIPEEASFSFIVYGDIQGNYQKGHDDLVKQMLKENAQLVFNTGDISPHAGKHYVRDFYPVIEQLARRTPFLPAVGNHDVNWESSLSRYPFYTFFYRTYAYLSGLPLNEHLQDPTTQKLWYRLVYGDSLFVVLDSNLFIDEGHYRSTHRLEAYRHYRDEQLVWVRKVLERAHRDPAIRHKFIFFHHSPFISDETQPVPLFGWGGHPGHHRMVVDQTVPSSGDGDEFYLLDLFRLYRVTAVFTGHEHYYERWREIIRERGRPIHSLNWIVTGMGGVKPRGRPEYEEDEIDHLLRTEPAYRRYLERISQLNPAWTADLVHAYPTAASPVARFHNYVLVNVGKSSIRFQTKDKLGNIRDEGSFALTDFLFQSTDGS